MRSVAVGPVNAGSGRARYAREGCREEGWGPEEGGAQGHENGPAGAVQQAGQAGQEGRAEECPSQGEQGCDDPANDRTGEGRYPGGDHERYGLAGPQRARIHLDGWQEAWRPDRVLEE